MNEQLLPTLNTSMNTIKIYENALQQVLITKKKQKFYYKTLIENTKQSKSFDSDYGIYCLIDKIKQHIVNNNTIVNNTNDYINYNIKKVYNILVNNNFIQNYIITENGTIAHTIKEVHSLAMSDTFIYTTYFDKFSASEIVAYLSIFTNIRVTDECKTIKPLSRINYITEAVIHTNDRINYYNDLENSYEIYTATPSDINFDFIDYMLDWCICSDELSCRQLLERIIKDKNIFLGDFVKAILKINNIANEIDSLCDIVTNKFSLQVKIREITKITMKFIVTNQSLYI